ncbi:MAG: VCBS repeat-containing protein [Candidatus Omnitrophica bacterium]|nr:VCBS repeat-containing protein [Candidatus Omnitrophota bacterium]MDD5352923.1 VCBS repeat-containing protein [Candidatus Omnitrophota bacterium]MDD5550522.1 VCBS repeat-containing protein [Candidatus Omnitrophota bacterium]
MKRIYWLILCGLLILTASGCATINGRNQIRFSEHLILDNYDYIFGIAAADLDGDGDIDLTSTNATTKPKSLYWFENDGTGVFTKHIAYSGAHSHLERHAIGDIDSDGHPDIVAVNNTPGELLWFRNDGTPQDGQPWQEFIITPEMPYAYDVALADLDKDGDLDVIAIGYKGYLAWFENVPSLNGRDWIRHPIDDSKQTGNHTIRVADFDGDKDLDLLSTVHSAHMVVWYENCNGARSFQKHIVDSKTLYPTHGQPFDIDKDGDMDIVMAFGKDGLSGDRDTHQIAWYENTSGSWTKHIIYKGFNDAFEVVAGDLDNDGDVGVVATSWRKPGRMAWFHNPGGKEDIPWKMLLLKKKWRSANNILLADLNGDNKLDIVACAERLSQELRWWRNEGKLFHEDKLNIKTSENINAGSE